jgi:DNA-binding NarL/FixJ family response regulator
MSLHSRPRIRRRDSLLVEFLATKAGGTAHKASRNELRALAEENDAVVQEARSEAALGSVDAAEAVSRKIELVSMAKRHLGSERQRALSAKRKKLRAERKRNGVPAHPDRVRILLADDHPVVRRGVRAILEGEPTFEIVGEASSGPETMEKVRELDPLIVILDISMPTLNGLDVTRQLKREAPDVRVLILTMHFAEEVARECLRAGARAYLLKTDTDSDLVAAVRAVRDEKPFLTPQIKDMYYNGYMECTPAAPADANGEVPLTRLTSREREVVKMLCEGMSNKEVAGIVGISTRTVESHRTNIMHKLNLVAFSDMVKYAVRHHVVAP